MPTTAFIANNRYIEALSFQTYRDLPTFKAEPIEIILEFVSDKTYLQPYPSYISNGPSTLVKCLPKRKILNKTETKKGRFERGSHGATHGHQVAILAKVMFHFYQNPPLKRLFDADRVLQDMIVDYSEEGVLKLLQVAAFFHDSMRQANGVDLWDDDSANAFEKFLRKACPFITKENHIKYMVAALSGKDDASNKTIFKKCVHDADCIEVIRVRNNFKLNYLDAYNDLLSECTTHNAYTKLNFKSDRYEQYFETGLGELYQMVLAERHCLIKQGRAKRACSISFTFPMIEGSNQTRFLFPYNGIATTPAVATPKRANTDDQVFYEHGIRKGKQATRKLGSQLIDDAIQQHEIFKKYLSQTDAAFEDIDTETNELQTLPISDLKFQLMALRESLKIQEWMNQDKPKVVAAIQAFNNDVTKFVSDIQNQTIDKTEVIKQFANDYESRFGKQYLQRSLPTLDRIVSSVLVAACAFTIGAAVGFTIGFVMGAWTGPGAAVTAVSGALLGGAHLMATVMGWSIIGATLVPAAVNAGLHNKIQRKVPLLNNGLFGQRKALHTREQVKMIEKTAYKSPKADLMLFC